MDRIRAVLRPEFDDFIAPMSCIRDGREHAVSDRVFAEGVEKGGFQALCGRMVIPGAMHAPAGAPCSDCLAALGSDSADSVRPADFRVTLKAAAEYVVTSAVKSGNPLTRPELCLSVAVPKLLGGVRLFRPRPDRHPA